MRNLKFGGREGFELTTETNPLSNTKAVVRLKTHSLGPDDRLA